MRSIVIFRFFSHLSLLFVYQCITFLPLIFRFSFYKTIANRASDALLNYMEACYEKNGNLDAKAQSYWRAFRERAHPDTDYNKTIAATVMSEEAKNDWGEERLITLGNWSIQPCITSIG